jgi:hypothetical protein
LVRNHGHWSLSMTMGKSYEGWDFDYEIKCGIIGLY